MTLGSETRPLLVDVGLKFLRAEIHMIKLKTEGQVNN